MDRMVVPCVFSSLSPNLPASVSGDDPAPQRIAFARKRLSVSGPATASTGHRCTSAVVEVQFGFGGLFRKRNANPSSDPMSQAKGHEPVNSTANPMPKSQIVALKH
jgi:hypothetical protein